MRVTHLRRGAPRGSAPYPPALYAAAREPALHGAGSGGTPRTFPFVPASGGYDDLRIEDSGQDVYGAAGTEVRPHPDRWP